MLAENDLQPDQIQGTGKEGRITKEDVIFYIESNREKSTKSAETKKEQHAAVPMGAREERRVPMTRLRAKIAERLLQAQHNAAMLTTFNEVNLKAVMDMRAQYKDSFEKKHGVKLGFMSFFTKAVVESLKRFPAVNASIDGQDVVYHGFYDIGIAVSTERGLVVPVIRDADQMSMAEIELAINDAAAKARSGKLSMEEMQGGTFTITNGGVFGSLLATPIINPPQTGILGMHKIEDRPVAEKGQVVIRPMMYVALSYDHRLIDGKDSVQFLVSVKELLEDPARLLLNV
jgi:2-oxoglutarate dehydrogenase E2 component (dihydrolipoamide succinyltransferase)